MGGRWAQRGVDCVPFFGSVSGGGFAGGVAGSAGQEAADGGVPGRAGCEGAPVVDRPPGSAAESVSAPVPLHRPVSITVIFIIIFIIMMILLYNYFYFSIMIISTGIYI